MKWIKIKKRLINLDLYTSIIYDNDDGYLYFNIGDDIDLPYATDESIYKQVMKKIESNLKCNYLYIGYNE